MRPWHIAQTVCETFGLDLDKDCPVAMITRDRVVFRGFSLRTRLSRRIVTIAVTESAGSYDVLVDYDKSGTDLYSCRTEEEVVKLLGCIARVECSGTPTRSDERFLEAHEA